jgi:hypothetical protein
VITGHSVRAERESATRCPFEGTSSGPPVRRLFYSTRKVAKRCSARSHNAEHGMAALQLRNAELRRRFAQWNAKRAKRRPVRAAESPAPAGVESPALPADSARRRKIARGSANRDAWRNSLHVRMRSENILTQVELHLIPSRVRPRAKCRGHDDCLQAATPTSVPAAPTHLLAHAKPPTVGGSSFHPGFERGQSASRGSQWRHRRLVHSRCRRITSDPRVGRNRPRDSR